MEISLGGISVPERAQAVRRTSSHRVAAVAAALTMLLLAVAPAPASAVVRDVGYEGPSYAGTSRAASGTKPETKLWYAHGIWWAVMWDTVSADWHIFRLVRSTHTWADTGVLVDKRAGTLADALYESRTDTLYIASHVVTTKVAVADRPARLMRYRYVDGVWKRDRGFPTQIMNYSSETLTIADDSYGNVWASWTQAAADNTGAVYVARGTRGGETWGKPFLVPSPDPGASQPRPDDISAIVALGGSVGVLWSNQRASTRRTPTLYWSTHVDGTAVKAWTTTAALVGPKLVDDHLSVKVFKGDPAGRVFAVFKTNRNDVSNDPAEPGVMLATYQPGVGWSATTVWTIHDCITRPTVVIDKAAQLLRVTGTAPESGCRFSGEPGVIEEKTAPLANPVFAPGRGKVVMRDADSRDLSNVTGSKQAVTNGSGLVLLATNSATKRYWFIDSKAKP